MRKVVVNSTPLIALCGIRCFDLLRDLYGEIFIPEAVYREVTAVEDSACSQLKNAGEWVHVKQIGNFAEKKMYQAKLHDGEVEVMILAREQNAELVIIDDNAAKKTAKFLGLTVTGTLGVLLKAKKQGLVTEIAPLLSELKGNGFYMNPDLEVMILEQEGELNL